MLRPKRPSPMWSAVTHLLGGDDRMKQRRVNGAEAGDARGGGEQPGRPGDGLKRFAVQVGIAAVALPAADRQHEVDAGLVAHLGEREAILPARRPALRHLGGGAARRAVGAEQPELEGVGVVHVEAVALRRGGTVEQGRNSGCWAARLDVWPAERSLHFAADAHGRVARIEFHVRPFQPLALGDVAGELDVLGEAERKISRGKRSARPASACPRRRSRPRRPAPRPSSGRALRWRPRRSGSRWVRRSARGGAPRSRPRCRARGRSCGSGDRARRSGRSCPAAWRIPQSSAARSRSRPRSRRRCRAPDDAARPCRRGTPTT